MEDTLDASRCTVAFHLALLSISMLGCSTSPEQQTVAAETPRCNREATTGSHIPRCDEGVGSVTRELPPPYPLGGPIVGDPSNPSMPGRGGSR